MPSPEIFFYATITSAVGFAAGERTIYTNDLRKFEVHLPEIGSTCSGSAAGINWMWHTILHAWHTRIVQRLEYHGFRIWSAKYFSQYWKFADYVRYIFACVEFMKRRTYDLFFFLFVSSWKSPVLKQTAQARGSSQSEHVRKPFWLKL